MRFLQKLSLAAVIAVFLGTTLSPANADTWNFWGNDESNNSHASKKKKNAIDSGNVAGLEAKWTFDMSVEGDCANGAVGAAAGCSSYVKPTVADGVVYFTDYGGSLWAVDADDGSLVWRAEINDLTGLPPIPPFPPPPASGPFKDYSRNSPAIDGDTLYLGSAVTGTVIAVDRADGSLKWKTVVDPHPLAHITASLVVNGNSVYVGVSSSGEGDALGWYFCDLATGGAPFCRVDYRSFRGSVVALDKNTGSINWKTHMIPEPPDPEHPEEWFSGVAIWGSHLAIDSNRGAIYVTTGNNYYLPADLMNCVASGIPEDDCLAAFDIPDNYVDSILSLSLGNGNINWATKLQGYDPWTVPCTRTQPFPPFDPVPRPFCPRPNGPDYDFAQGAMTWSAKVDGKNTDLVGAAGKSGIFWALDRDTGQVVWANEDGTGDLFGGSQWGSATNGKVIVVPNTVPMSAELIDELPAGAETCSASGYWRGIDAGTGITDWFSCGPVGDAGRVLGPVSISQDVAFAGSLEDGTANMVALDLSDGMLIRTFPEDTVPNDFSSNSAPSIVDGSIYWTSGFGGFTQDVVGNDKVYAFELP